MHALVSWPAARFRLIAMLAVVLIGLGLAWCAIELFHLVSVTVFQPFRMATLVAESPWFLSPGGWWPSGDEGTGWGRLRAILITVAFTGDWLLVVLCLAELAVSAAEEMRARLPWCGGLAARRSPRFAGDDRTRYELSWAP